MTPADTAALSIAVVTVGGGLYASIAYVLTPRIERAITAQITPIADRATALEERQSTTDVRIENLFASQERTEKAIASVGRDIKGGMDNLADSIRKLAERHSETEKDVAEMRGRLEASAFRRRRSGTRAE